MTYGLGSTVKFHMNGEIIDLIPVRAAHTGGDTMVRFENANAIMIGDFYRNYGYPYIDTNNGGSLKGALEALNTIMELAGPDTKLIPGHGTIINRKDIIPYRDMIFAVQAKVQQMIAQGKTLAGSAGRQGDRSLRCQSSRQHGGERRPFCGHGLFGIEGWQSVARILGTRNAGFLRRDRVV